MILREFLSSKAVTLCFLAIGMLTTAGVLFYAGLQASLILMFLVFILLLTAAWVSCGYVTEKRKIKKLEQTADSLNDAYLLGELLPKPKDALEKRYFDVMKRVSRSAIGKAEQAIREKEDYCNYVESWIHEIKTPLTACSLILANGGDARKLKQELKRADNITESILYYARMRTAQKDLRITRIQIASVIESAVKSQTELLTAAKINVETEGDFIVETDKKQVEFILKQFLINCAKYCKGCTIQIEAQNGVIRFRDNGPGIPKHEIHRITDRGFSGEAARKTGSSTGMGLYIASEICKQLQIDLQIDSVPGEYTEFRMCFENLTKL